MIGAHGTERLGTPDALRLGGAVAAVSVLLTAAMATGGSKGGLILALGTSAVLVGILVVLRPVAVGLPLLVVVIFANASDLLSRLFSIPSVLQGLFALLLVALVTWRRRFDPVLVMRHPVSLALLAYGAVLLISSVWALNPAATDGRVADIGRGFLLFAIAATLAGSSPAALRRATTALVLTAGALASLSLFQVATGRYDQQFGRFAAVQFGHLFGQVREARIAGPIDDPNFYAQILLIAIPLGVALALGARRRVSRAGFALVSLAIAAAMLLTYSRGAMLAFAAMIVLLPFLVPVRRIMIPGAVLALASVLVLVPTDLGRRLATIQNTITGEDVERDSSVGKRKLLLSSALGMFRDHPVGGVGGGNFDEHYRRYAREIGFSAPHYDDPGEPQYPHSLLAEVAAENGLMGLLSFGGLLLLGYGTAMRAARQLRHAGQTREGLIAGAVMLSLTGYLVSALFLHGSFQRYLWLLLAIAVAADLAGRMVATDPQREVRQ